MTAVLTRPNPTAVTAAPIGRRLTEARVAGIGGVTFATTALVTNVLLRSTPAHDASAAEVTRFLTEHRAVNVFSAVVFALGAPFLLAFATAFYGRLKAVGRPEDQVWARLGFVGGMLILPTFAAVVTNRLVLLAGGDELIGTPELVSLVWRFESAAFLLNTVPLAIAVLGFGIAGSRAGLLPRWFARLAPVGAVCGILSAATAVLGLEGAPTIFGGLVAFLTWMTLLYAGGIRQLRAA